MVIAAKEQTFSCDKDTKVTADTTVTIEAQVANGTSTPTAARAISDAHAVCKALDQGHSGQEVIDAVAQSTGLSAKGAKIFAVDASAYCPQ
jgi:Protein of unknown function (DUF732)